MARTKLVADFRIILGALVHILDHQHDRRARRHLAIGAVILKNTGQNFDRVRFLPLRGEAALPRPALVEKTLNISGSELYARRAAVHHAAQCWPMALTESCHAKQMAEGVV